MSQPLEILMAVLGILTLVGGIFTWTMGQIKRLLDDFSDVKESIHDIKVALLGGIGNPGIAARMDQIEEYQEANEARMHVMENRLAQVDARLTKIEANTNKE